MAVGIADRLDTKIIHTPVNERIVRFRITHILGEFSLIYVYAPTGMNEFSVKEAFYAQLQKVLDSCPKGDTLMIKGDFGAITGTDGNVYESCWSTRIWVKR